MRRPIVGSVLFLIVVSLASAASPEGRWRGSIHIPGRELDVVVDLAATAAGAGTGSLIVPGTGIKGAPVVRFS